MFLMATPVGKTKNAIVLRFGEIVKRVSEEIASEILTAYVDCATDVYKRQN